MSALETLRPIMEKYIVEPDSLQTAFDEPTTDLFSLGLDSMGSFALLDDLAAEGAVSWWRTRLWSSSPPAWAKFHRTPSAYLPRMQTGARGVCYSPRLPLSAYFCQRELAGQ